MKRDKHMTGSKVVHRFAAIACVAVLGVAAAGCGSNSKTGTNDQPPATIAPAATAATVAAVAPSASTAAAPTAAATTAPPTTSPQSGGAGF